MTEFFFALVLICVLLLMRIPIFLTLIVTGATLLFVFKDMPVQRQLVVSVWNLSTSESLLALPLFILMAEILFRTRLSERIFEGLAPIFGRLPGGLVHLNVVMCTIFASVCGSSAATTAAVGKISLHELQRLGYPRGISLGSLAGAGTLGFLIPPSIVMIVYGVQSETSIISLFIAGIVPGLLLAAMYMCYIAVHAKLSRSWDEAGGKAQRISFSPAAFWRGVAPILGLILCVLGSMYLGIASPTEAGAIGVAGAIVVSVIDRSLSFSKFVSALSSAAESSAVIGMIIVGAFFLTTAFALIGIPNTVLRAVDWQALHPLVVILVLYLIYIFLGCFLEGISIIVMTLPLALPIVMEAGFSKLWFGIFIVLMVELAQITPPVGFNLFVIQKITQEKLGYIAACALPFFFLTSAMVIIVTLFPQIVTVLL